MAGFMKNASYKTIIQTGNEDPTWDDFLSEMEFSHYEQSTCWSEFKKQQGWFEAIRIKIFKDSQFIAGAQMLCKPLPVGGHIGYISSGPICTQQDVPSLVALIGAINDLAKKKRIQYIAITPYIENAQLDQILLMNGYNLTNELLPPTTTVRATLLLDLSKDLDTLLMEMRYKTRKQIKHALKSGLTFREGQKNDLNTLFTLMALTAVKRGEKPVPASVDIFNTIWDCFYSKDYVKLFIVEFEGHPIVAGIIFTFGNTVRFWKIGWSGDETKKYPTQFIYWELIKWSKINGFRYFDIIYVDPVVTDHLLKGLPSTDAQIASRSFYGPTLFKMGFGGQVVKFSGPWFRFQNPLIGFLYKYFGPAIMKLPFTNKIISKFS
jgi:lipid II:glycine glycyltransferase (peptidoglycan interpeptide bridge formation enzyme)